MSEDAWLGPEGNCILLLQASNHLQVDGRLVERKATAAQQSMLQRAQRREKAQVNAAAAQAQMLAAQQAERQSSQRSRHDQGGPATLQQVCAMHCLCTLAADTCQCRSLSSEQSAQQLLTHLHHVSQVLHGQLSEALQCLE